MKKSEVKTAEEKFEEAAESWNADPEKAANAAEKYFMPGKDILQKLKPCKTDDPVQLVLSGIAAGDIAGEPYEGSCAKDMYPDLDYRDLPFFRPGSHFTKLRARKPTALVVG